jgi:hypothetical protein
MLAKSIRVKPLKALLAPLGARLQLCSHDLY